MELEEEDESKLEEAEKDWVVEDLKKSLMYGGILDDQA